MSIGIKPKIVDLTSFTFRESLLTVEAGLDSINQKILRQISVPSLRLIWVWRQM